MTICCSFVPANCPRIACVTDVGCWTVKEYINMELVVAMLANEGPEPGMFYLLVIVGSNTSLATTSINLILR